MTDGPAAPGGGPPGRIRWLLGGVAATVAFTSGLAEHWTTILANMKTISPGAVVVETQKTTGRSDGGTTDRTHVVADSFQPEKDHEAKPSVDCTVERLLQGSVLRFPDYVYDVTAKSVNGRCKLLPGPHSSKYGASEKHTKRLIKGIDVEELRRCAPTPGKLRTWSPCSQPYRVEFVAKTDAKSQVASEDQCTQVSQKILQIDASQLGSGLEAGLVELGGAEWCYVQYRQTQGNR